MSHRLSKERLKQRLQNKPKNGIDEIQTMSKREWKRLKMEEKKKSWLQQMRARGGLRQRKAKKWGDDCSISQCPKWEDGSCQYPERDIERCFMELKQEKDKQEVKK